MIWKDDYENKNDEQFLPIPVIVFTAIMQNQIHSEWIVLSSFWWDFILVLIICWLSKYPKYRKTMNF